MLQTTNHLIEGLPDLSGLFDGRVKATVLPAGRTIYVPGEEFPSVYLIEKGLATFVCGEGSAALHVAMIGREGMICTKLLSGEPDKSTTACVSAPHAQSNFIDEMIMPSPARVRACSSCSEPLES